MSPPVHLSYANCEEGKNLQKFLNRMTFHLNAQFRIFQVAASAFSLSLCVSGAESFANSKNLPVPDFLVTTALGKAPYFDCSRNVRSEKANLPIRVCLQGDGFYHLRSIKLASNATWFKNNENLILNQVDEVRFVCAKGSNGAETEISQVIFPDGKETSEGRKIRIEIPCRSNPIETLQSLNRAKLLIARSINQPMSVMATTSRVSTTCEQGTLQKDCVFWKKVVGDILTGESMNRFLLPFKWCDTFFNVGLFSQSGVKIEKQIHSAQGFDALDEVDLTSPLDPNNLEIGYPELEELAEKLLPNCNAHTCGPALDGGMSYTERCQSEFENVKKMLTRRGVTIRADGSYHIKGRENKMSRQLSGNALEAMTHSFMFKFEQSIECEATLQIEKNGNSIISKLGGTQDEWRTAANSSLTEGSEITFKDGSANSGFLWSPDCGFDLKCHMRVEVIRNQFYEQYQEKLKGKESGCYQISNSAVNENGQLSFELQKKDDGCVWFK